MHAVAIDKYDRARTHPGLNSRGKPLGDFGAESRKTKHGFPITLQDKPHRAIAQSARRVVQNHGMFSSRNHSTL